MFTLGEVLRDNTVTGPLGSGSFAFVFKVQNPSHATEVALKVCKLNPTAEERARFLQENIILNDLHSPAPMNRIVAPLSSNEQEGDYLYYLMELADSNLDAYLNSNYDLTNEQRIDVFKKICTGVKHAHQKNVIHRDLWWNNVLICLGQDLGVKLCDFGRAKDYNLEPLSYMDRPCVGHIYVRPPELFFTIADETDIDLSKCVDFYALGVLLSFLFNADPILYYSEIMGQILTYLQKNSITNISQKALQEKKDIYNAWLDSKSGHSYDKLNVSLVDFDLTKSLNKIIAKLCDIDYTQRYSTVEEIEHDLENLNL